MSHNTALHEMMIYTLFFFFKQKTAYEIGLGIPAEPLFRSKYPLQNQRYGSSHIGATAKDISNVVTDAASGVVDIFRSEERRVGKECIFLWLSYDNKIDNYNFSVFFWLYDACLSSLALDFIF